MTFTQSIKTCFGKYATFSGRASRSEYWWFFLFVLLVGLIPIIGSLISLAALIPSIAVAARRLHDSDRSGWWQVAPQGAILAAMVLMSIEANILAAAAGIAAVGTLIMLLVWLVREGDISENRFGPDPLATVQGPTGTADGDPSLSVSRIPTVKRDD